ncbi:MAG: hypothetical protein CMJ78_11130 [Planctomycetaceae bacterium]|nr:hypothetical protein [Planctomycetaceae bacterium]
MSDQIRYPCCDNVNFDESDNRQTTQIDGLNRRQFVQAVGASAAAACIATPAFAKDDAKSKSEALVKKLYDSLSEEQREEICFDWEYSDDRGLLRTHVSNNWNITDAKLNVGGNFFTKDQQDIIEAIFWGLYSPEWKDKIRKQLKDDAGGYGKRQSIAIFGEPGSDQFEFVMTGRHLTIRCDGNSADHVAFGGPIFYGHAAQGFNEKADHPGNVFWEQGLKANALYKMLDGKQQKLALLERQPRESAVAFQGKKSELPGIPVSELSSDQKEHMQKVLGSLLAPYRVSDREDAMQCLKKQGGLDACSIAFYQRGDIGNDQVWDNWRLEGPSFVWYFRGAPHVHVWVNVADSAIVKLNARG